MNSEPIYMNIATGETGTRDEWDYVNQYGDVVSPVDMGEVVQVEQVDGCWQVVV